MTTYVPNKDNSPPDDRLLQKDKYIGWKTDAFLPFDKQWQSEYGVISIKAIGLNSRGESIRAKLAASQKKDIKVNIQAVIFPNLKGPWRWEGANITRILNDLFKYGSHLVGDETSSLDEECDEKSI